jgi:hypothetical protein
MDKCETTSAETSALVRFKNKKHNAISRMYLKSKHTVSQLILLPLEIWYLPTTLQAAGKGYKAKPHAPCEQHLTFFDQSD